MVESGPAWRRASGRIPPAVGESGAVHIDGARIRTNTLDPKTSPEERLVEARTDADGLFRLRPVEPSSRNRFES
jgi:hypothetical protein